MNENSQENKLYFKYWGKASKEDSSYHLLPYHCLDVAAVASEWWKQSPSIRDSFIKSTELSDEQSRAWVLFFIALHDFGKLDMRFQMKAPHLSPYEDKNIQVNCKKYYHGIEGYNWYFREAVEYGLPVIEEYEEITVNGELWMSATGGHHGTIPLNPEEDSITFPIPKILAQDQQARKQWLHDLEELFLQPVGLSLTDMPDSKAPILLAGFCSVCDWLGSNQDYFKFNSDTSLSLQKHLDSKQENAQKILDDFGLLSKVKTTGGMTELYDNFTPHNIQTRIDDLAIEQSLVIIEANTGSGKTEAALAFASKLLANKLADSITFALPSQATANAMFERLEFVAEKIFSNTSNIILAHGKSQSNPNFQALIQHSEDFKSAQDDEEAGVQCSEWLASSRKRAFLGQIAVSTVDQVMLSAIKLLQHYFVRLFGVGKSILIIDEIHAYDAYMYAILKVVIEQQKQAGGSIILLSATLPKHQKQALINAWGVSEPIAETVYPLMLQAVNNKVLSFTVHSSRDKQLRPIFTELIIDNELKLNEKILQRIVDAIEKGAKVGIVCNLVDDAQHYAKALANMTNKPVDLFHSRYRYCDRMSKEQQVLKYYKKDSPREGRILVGTQVIEQSLDIDIDWLISFICPIDLLFQRMGRLHRHDDNDRPAGFKQPLCSIVLPETIDLSDTKSAEDAYGLHGFIYKNIRALWRTQQFLLNHDKIEFPQAYRDWIEPIYQQTPWKDEPDVITSLSEEYADDQFASECIASDFTKDKSFFHDTEGNAALLTREGELNLSVILMIKKEGKKYFLDEKTLIPKPDDKYNRETLSQNSLAVPSSATWKKFIART